MLDTLEQLRRQRPEVCSCCGWDMVLTDVGYQCHNVQGCAAYSTADPDDEPPALIRQKRYS